MLKLDYYTKLLIFSALISVIVFFMAQTFGISLYYIVLLSVYFTLFSVIFNMRLQASLLSVNKNQFTFTFLGLTGLKMLSCLFILMFGLYFSKSNKLELGICTMSYYMLYTTFEVWHWMNKLKQN